MVQYKYNAWGECKVLNASGVLVTDTTHIGHINPHRYRGYYYDIETGLYYLKSRYYFPTICRFISMDDISFADPDSINGLNLYAYCGNNPVMNVDPEGHFPVLAVILGLVALAGLGTTVAGVALDNNIVTAIGLTAISVPALISGGIAIAAGIGGATLAGIIGGVTMGAGLGSGLFASAEYQEAFTGNNWILNTGISEGWYNGLMLATASIATIGTIASMVGVVKYQNFGNSNWYGGWRKMRAHYLKHGKQMGYRNAFDYTNAAKGIVGNNGGVYASKVNAYVQWIDGNKYFYVGVGRGSNFITTYFIKTIKYAKYLSIL